MEKEANKKIILQGGKLAGGNPQRGRVENDFYATPEIATEALMKVEKFNGNIWEPACGDGKMSKVLKKYNKTISSDLYDRGYGATGVDFLIAPNVIYDNLVTNPPFEFFQNFAEKAIREAKYKVALFGKLQALEGQKRATFLENSPLKVVYVFKKRINPLRNGSATDENGKKWASTMAFAWYVWERGYTGSPIIKWI
jgi:hypothetical protein